MGVNTLSHEERGEAGDYHGKKGTAYEGEVAVGIHDESIIPEGTIDPVYEAKARVLNRAIQEIGMGKFQWQLFVVISFGWASDNLWPIATSLICEFSYSGRFLVIRIDYRSTCCCAGV